MANSKRGQNEGSFVKRGDRWQCRVSLGYKLNEKGERVRDRRAVSGATRAEARKLAAALKAQQRMDVVTPVMTLVELTDAFLYANARRLKGNTLDSYRVAAKRFLPVLGRIRVDALATAQIERWLLSERDRGYAYATVKGYKRILSCVLSWGIAQGVRVDNPCSYAKLPGHAPPKRIRALNEAQCDAVRALAAEDAYGPRWTVFLGCALRRGELLGLKWGDIDWERRTLAIRRQRVFDPVLRRIDERAPKTDGSAATIPLSLVVRDALVRWRMQQPAPPDDDDYVFHGHQSPSLPLTPNQLQRDWVDARTSVGITHRLHDLRHTTASMLYRLREPDGNIMLIMRHANIITTHDTYTHITLDDLHASMDALDAHFQARQGFAEKRAVRSHAKP